MIVDADEELAAVGEELAGEELAAVWKTDNVTR